MEQLLAHLAGDYLLQNKWMAEKKLESFWVALLHGFTYTVPFVLITTNLLALILIGVSHALVDYYKIGNILQWAKEQVAPKQYRSTWKQFEADFPGKPAWINFWLRVIIDNALHLLINFAILIYIAQI